MAIMPKQRERFSWWSAEAMDFWLQHVRPHWSLYRAYALVQERYSVAKEAEAIVLKPNRHVPPCQPGQYVSVTLEVNGVRRKRYYSPTVLPDGRWQITVRRVANGQVSGWIHEHLTRGAVVELGCPAGEFHQVDPQQPILLMAAGSGITPMYSLLSHWLGEQGLSTPIHLHYWASRREQLCFHGEFESWAQQHQGFEYFPYLTQDTELLPHERQGRFDLATFKQQYPNLSSFQLVACGPFGFVQQVQALQPLVAQWHSESHEVPKAQGPEGERFVTLMKTGKTVAVPANKTLLEGLEDAGVEVPFGCRRGVCNTCSCQRVEGATKHLVSAHTTEGDGVIQLCVSQAMSNLQLNL